MKHRIATFIFFVLVLLLAFSVNEATQHWRWIGAGALLIIYLLLTAWGSYKISLNWFLNSVNRVPGKEIMLTFDDGPDLMTTPAILDILKKFEIKAMFFVIGSKAEVHPEVILRIMEEGHVIGNHSYLHENSIGIYSRKKLFADIKRCSDVIEGITGIAPQHFRPPFGVTNPRFAQVLASLDMRSVGWSLRSYDTVVRQPERLLSYVFRRLRPGSIVLFHDNQKVTVTALPEFLKECREKDFIFTSTWP